MPRRAQPDLPTEDFTVLLLDVRGTTAALPLASVEKVVPYVWLTAIPEAPPWAAGVLELAGRAVYVMDVGARIAGDAHCPGVDDFIVICTIDDRYVGLCVTGLYEVINFSADTVSPPLADIPAAPYLIGTINHGNRPILFLSVERLLRTSGFIALTSEIAT
jgi:chemotaxis signal transduction protein